MNTLHITDYKLWDYTLFCGTLFFKNMLKQTYLCVIYNCS